MLASALPDFSLQTSVPMLGPGLPAQLWGSPCDPLSLAPLAREALFGALNLGGSVHSLSAFANDCVQGLALLSYSCLKIKREGVNRLFWTSFLCVNPDSLQRQLIAKAG